MTDKLKVWKCDDCDEIKECFSIVPFRFRPVSCLFTHVRNTKWQETEEYQIIKKPVIGVKIEETASGLPVDETLDFETRAKTKKISDYKPGDREYDEILAKAGVYKTDFGTAGFAEAEKLKITEPSEEKTGFDLQAAFAEFAKAGAYSGIIEPDSQKTPNSKILIFKSRDEMDDFLKSRVEPTAPNCSICEWKKSEGRLENETKDGSYFETTIFMCSAQGMRDCDDEGVYNSKECRILFRSKPEKEK